MPDDHVWVTEDGRTELERQVALALATAPEGAVVASRVAAVITDLLAALAEEGHTHEVVDAWRDNALAILRGERI